MRLLAPAKINLYLRVGKPRADGFHPIVSWMCTVGLFDTLIIDRSRSQPEHRPEVSLAPGPARAADGAARATARLPLTLECDPPGLPCDASNLVAKAAVAFAGALSARSGREAPPSHAGDLAATSERTSPPRAPSGSPASHGIPGEVPHVEAKLLKRIPVGAGLGGGSSDGARTLAALNALWKAGWSDERLAELSATLGSDLPFFFHGESAVCRGRGEWVQRITRPRPRTVLLVFPGRPMPTPPVYRKFDELNLGSDTSQTAEPDWSAWTHLSALELLPKLVNDLESAAFAIDPALGQLRADVEQWISRPVRMSGSGSTLFSLYDEAEEADADRVARMLTERKQTQALVVEVAPKLMDDLNAVPAKQ